MVRRPERIPVLLSYATFILIGIGAGVRGVVLLAQLHDYDVDRATLGLTFFVGSAGFVLAGITSGPMIHRFGVRLSLAAGAVAFVAAAGYTATRPPFVAFVLVQLVAGYGGGMLESVLQVYLTVLPDSTTLLNRLHAFFGVGALIGPVLASWLLGFVSWSTVFALLALAGLPLLAGFLLAYPRLAGDPTAVTTEEPGPARGRGLVATALRQPAVLLGAFFLTVYVGLELGLGNWMYSFLVESRDLSDLLAGYTVSGYWLGLTLGRFLISPVAKRIGLDNAGLMYTCVGGVVVAVGLTWLVTAPVLAGIGFILVGFFLGPIYPTTMAIAPALTTQRLLPTAMGVMNAGSVVGGSGLPWLAGAIAQGVGIWTLLPFGLALALVQLAVWWRLAARVRKPVLT